MAKLKFGDVVRSVRAKTRSMAERKEFEDVIRETCRALGYNVDGECLRPDPPIKPYQPLRMTGGIRYGRR